MSWEDQGRQFHQWFGHGTAGGVDAEAGAERTEDVAGAVGRAAVAALGRAQGRGLARVLADGGAEDVAAALPIWVASAGLAADRFRALVVGPGFGVAAAASLQAMARVVARSGDAGDAGAHLAAALGEERQSEWGYKLNYARDMAEYAAANGTVPAGVALKGPAESGPVRLAQYAVPSRPGPFPIIPRMVPGSPENERLTRETIRDLRAILEALGRVFQSRNHSDDDEHDEDGETGGRQRRLKPKPTPPKPETGEQPAPSAGGIRRLNESELKDAAKADGYDSVEDWKRDELELNATSDIAKDKDGNLYSILRRGTGAPIPLNVRVPHA